MSLYQIKNRAYDRMEKLYLYVFQKKKIFVLPSDTSPKLVCIDMLFHKIQGNGGARGASHRIILINPLSPKSDLNEIYHLSVREIMTIENMISQVKFC